LKYFKKEMIFTGAAGAGRVLHIALYTNKRWMKVFHQEGK
jgi:hypothetical protein